jgi:hypothetical protein
MLIRTGAFYKAFKYSVFALLTVNTGHFFFENLAGVSFTYGQGLNFGDIIVAYTDAIDTAAWLVLLLLLELETSLVPDEKLKGWAGASINAASVLCWAAIIYSFYGYVATLGVPYGFAPYAGVDPCGLVGAGASLATSLAQYLPLDAENCLTLAAGAYFNTGDAMFATPENVSLIKRLAWTDVVNAGIWLIIVVILELEIYLQSSKLFGGAFFIAYKSFKLVLYGVLVVDVFYWLALGEPWAAWDALLWLVAFFFIEMNMLSWQEENAKIRDGAAAIE